MSIPPSGNYSIINRVLSPAGQKLAITFNGLDQNATVTPLINAANQTWNIADFDGLTQSVSPINAPNLQVGMGSGNVIVTIPAGNYVWTIRNTSDGYTIQDGDVVFFWGLSSAINGEQVDFGQSDNSEKQDWILVPVSL